MSDLIVIREDGSQYLCDISHVEGNVESCELTLRMGRKIDEEEKEEWLREKERIERDRMFPRKSDKTMTKSELMENYTMEELADMVVKLQNASEVKNDEIQKLKWDISNLEESNGRLQARVDTYTNYLLPRCTKEAKELIDHNHFVGVKIVSIDEMKSSCDKEDEIKELKSQLHRKETEINQIDDILGKLFGVTHDIVKTPDEFEKILTEKTCDSKFISKVLPITSIGTAKMLTEDSLFDISELRQIAEHLLVYCNANESEGEE